jgi:hypothetical protein
MLQTWNHHHQYTRKDQNPVGVDVVVEIVADDVDQIHHVVGDGCGGCGGR